MNKVVVLLLLAVACIVALIPGNLSAQLTELASSPTGDAQHRVGIAYWYEPPTFGYRFYTADSFTLRIMRGLNSDVQYTINLLSGEFAILYYLSAWDDLNNDNVPDVILHRYDSLFNRESFRIVNPVDGSTLVQLDSAHLSFRYWELLDPGPDGNKSLVVEVSPYPYDGTYRYVVYSTSFPAAVGERTDLPERIRLHQNFPNPFNPSTEIEYELKASGSVEIDIYDVNGAKVKTLVNGRQEPGYHTIRWDGTSDSGLRVASGPYFYQLRTNEQTDVKKMLLLK